MPYPAEQCDRFFLPYQRAWMEDTSRIKVMEKSRQVGLSWTSAYNLVRRQCVGGVRQDAWVSSRDESSAKLFIDDCRRFAGLLNEMVQYSESDLGLLMDPKKMQKSHTLTFSNKRKIHSLSSNPDAQAGKRGSRLLDEFALHPDPQQLYAIAYPGITWGGQLEIVSTHRGAGNFFNQLVKEAREGGNPKGISLHRVTLEDALEQGFLAKLKGQLPEDDPRQAMDEGEYFDFIKSACPDEASFLQEYMCVPEDEASAFIPHALIDANLYAVRPEGPLYWQVDITAPESVIREKTQDLYLGVDIGRTHDKTVFWLIEKVHGHAFTRHISVLEKSPFHVQEQVLQSYLRLPTLRRVCIDQSGIGRHFAENAIRSTDPGRVEGISFTPAVKESLAYRVRSALEARKLSLPDDAAVRADLHAMRKLAGLSGNVRFDAPRNGDGHADRFWALALALHAGQQAQGPPAGRIARVRARPTRTSSRHF